MSDQPAKHAHQHIPGGPDPLPAVLFIKVFGDDEPVGTGDKKFEFEVSEDMDRLRLRRVESYVTTSGTGATTIQIRRVGVGDMLSTACSIDSGELNSKDAATQAVIDETIALDWGDHVAIDVDAAGSGAQGLGVMLTFGR